MECDTPAIYRNLLAALLLALVGAPPAICAPAVELSAVEEAVSLAVAWRFQPGDDLRWAEPNFDDSDWREVQIPTGFGRTDAKSELAWYRLEIQVGSKGRDFAEERSDLRLAVTIGKVDSAYEVFAGGIRLGGVGRLPPSPRMDYDRHGIYAVPAAAIGPEGRLVVALRVWKSPHTRGDVGGPHEGPFLFGSEARLTRRELLSELPVLFLAGFFLVVGLFHLELFRRRPQQSGYLWFFCCSAAFAGYIFLRTQWKYVPSERIASLLGIDDHFLLIKEVEYFLLFALVGGFVQLIWPLLGLRIGPLLRTYQWLNLATGLMVSMIPGLRLNVLVLPYWELSLMVLIAYGIWMIFRQAWRNHPEARVLAVGTIGSVATFLNDIAIDRGLFVGPRIIPFGFAFLILSLALSLANRFHRTHHELETLRRDLESRVEERTRQLVEANQAKSRFLATMSHEIRTPLNGVIGLTQLMLRTALSREQRDYARKTLQSGDTLLALIEDILDFSKIEAGKLTLEAQPFLLRDAVEQSLDLLAPKAAEKGLDLSCTIAPQAPEAVIGDQHRLRQVLVNLIGNAVKYTEEGAIRVLAEAHGEQLHFQVEDTGIGIPEDRLDQLFDAFTRIEAADGKLRRGTGLGLAICRRLCEAMGGAIGVESKVGRGSVFSFTIQAAAAATPRPTAEAKRQRAGLPPLRLLLAEDDAVNLTVVRGMLEHLGYQADVAVNGLEVLEALNHHTYDVVLLDVQMPVLDGLETARRIRRGASASERPRLIAMTAHAVKGDRERCLAAGMDDYVSKPLKLDQLRAVLERCESPTDDRPEPDRESSSDAMGDSVARLRRDVQPRVFDRAVLESLRHIDGEGEVLRAAIGTFLNDTPRNLAAVDAALTKGDADVVVRLVHSLKTAAGMMGGVTMMDLCVELERAVGYGALPEASPLLQSVQEQFERLEVELTAVLGEAPPAPADAPPQAR